MHVAIPKLPEHSTLLEPVCEPVSEPVCCNGRNRVPAGRALHHFGCGCGRLRLPTGRYFHAGSRTLWKARTVRDCGRLRESSRNWMNHAPGNRVLDPNSESSSNLIKRNNVTYVRRNLKRCHHATLSPRSLTPTRSPTSTRSPTPTCTPTRPHVRPQPGLRIHPRV